MNFTKKTKRKHEKCKEKKNNNSQCHQTNICNVKQFHNEIHKFDIVLNMLNNCKPKSSSLKSKSNYQYTPEQLKHKYEYKTEIKDKKKQGKGVRRTNEID